MSTNPTFVIVEAPSSISGHPARSITIPVKVRNEGGATGTVDVRVIDHNKQIAGISTATLGIREERVIQVEVVLPAKHGEYAWKIELFNRTTKTIDGSKNLIVLVGEPAFRIIDYTGVAKGAPGATRSISATVKNIGNTEGEVEVRVLYQGNQQDSKTISVAPGQLGFVSLTITLPPAPGTYTYRIEAINKYNRLIDDYKDVTVYVGDPKFKIYTRSSIEGYPTQQVSIAISVENHGYSGGYATVRLFNHNNEKIYEETKYIEVDTREIFYAKVQLPGEFGTYTWRVEVLNNKTQSIDDQTTITIYATQPPPLPLFKIETASRSIEGWVNEKKTIDVTVKNYGQQAGEVEVRVMDHNHKIVDARRITITGGGTGTVSLSIILPSRYGEYPWHIQLYNVSRNTIDDSRELVVKANDIHFQIVDYTRTVNGFPSEAKPVSVKVYNTGNTEGVAIIEIRDHNGVAIYFNQATISPNNTYTFYTFITLPPAPGTYEWKVELWNQSLNRKEQEETIYVVVAPITSYRRKTTLELTITPL